MPPRRSTARQASARQVADPQNALIAATDPAKGADDEPVAGPSTPRSPKSTSQKAWQGLPPVAIDLGAFSIRIVIGADAAKQVVTRCPNAIVRMPQQRRYHQAKGEDGSGKLDSSGLPANSLAGPHILSRCTDFGALSIRQPMDRGLVVDWAAQKIILDTALRDALARLAKAGEQGRESSPKGRLLEGRPVIITEAYFNLPDLQAAMDLLLVEEYGAKSIWRSAPAFLVPYTPDLFSEATHGSSKRPRPECMCIVDLGHGGTHVVPVVGEAVIWRAARRNVISQRLITNLLKESLSFRQWDMMDEPWLVGHIKERCCFVAGGSGQRAESQEDLAFLPPSQWSFAALTELCQSVPRAKNPIAQEYVLPDYSGQALKHKFGYIKSGPASVDPTGESKAEIRADDFIALPELRPKERIHDGDAGRNLTMNGTNTASDEDDEDDEEDDDFDADAVSEGDSSEGGQMKRKHAGAASSPRKKTKVVADDEDDGEQILVLERERFQVPEVMFNPGIIGLDDAPLHEVIKDAIDSCDEEARGPLWGNIVLVGGGAAMCNLETRLYNELRPLAPVDCPLRIHMPDDPAIAAVHAAQSMMASGAQSAAMRVLKSHLLDVSNYSAAAARQIFGSWNAEQTTSTVID